jgi:5'-3' exonuclease
MGIPYYFYTLTKLYHNIVSSIQPVKPDIYCLDFNGIIHPVAASIVSTMENIDENLIIEKLFKKVEDDISVIQPKKVLICVDGVAPLAKMIQQRKRRYLTVYKKQIDNEESKWDTNCITPGTQFMKSLNTYFKKRIRYNTLPINIIFSGSDEAGEGEHKIFTMLLNEKSDACVMINGLDADLIILCLMSHRKNIYLMRESNENTYVSIDNLRAAILQELSKKWKTPLYQNTYDKDTNDIIESYCVMCSLLGNDFIPHLLTLNLKTNGLEKLILCSGNTYTMHGLLVQNSKINYLALCDILQQLAKTENQDICEETQKYLKKGTYSNYQGKNTNSDFYGIKNKDSVADKIYANISNWRYVYYKQLFYANTTIDSSVISMACESFMIGIYWTYAYYKKHDYDNTWYYPYAYPPTLKDIANYAIGNNEPLMTKSSIELNSIIQLLIVLPIESKHLLEKKYQKMMESSTSGIYHLYPKQYKIHTFLKTHLWECAPILPMINIKYLRNHIN